MMSTTNDVKHDLDRSICSVCSLGNSRLNVRIIEPVLEDFEHLRTYRGSGAGIKKAGRHIGKEPVQTCQVRESQTSANMPTLAGRARPIEKFAEAVAKCGSEVSRGQWGGQDK